MYFIKCDDTNSVIEEISSLVSGRLEKFASLDIMHDLQVLCPTKKTDLGVIALNKLLQEILNKKEASKKEKSFGDRIFRVRR